jgi:1,4-dihydroxy-6-naphthoate synthase
MARHDESVAYAQSFGRGMDTEMVGRYVRAWVNDFTVDPGPRGRAAVARLLGMDVAWVQG